MSEVSEQGKKNEAERGEIIWLKLCIVYQNIVVVFFQNREKREKGGGRKREEKY